MQMENWSEEFVTVGRNGLPRMFAIQNTIQLFLYNDNIIFHCNKIMKAYKIEKEINIQYKREKTRYGILLVFLLYVN